jgi:arginyl-tRNA--protein-N-Asp/Glu arginylyltransferase
LLIATYYNPFLSPKRLDRFLAHGWFRNCNMLGKQKIVCLSKGISQVINIRVCLDAYQYPKKLQKLFEQNNKRFRYEINSPRLTSEKETLYQEQKSRFKGLVMPTLQQSLFGTENGAITPFHSQEISVYDGNKLVASSYFDVGYYAVASILGLFHQAYSKFSLGIYTMLLEIDLAMQLGKKFYYPGYVLHKDPSFDYKLRLGNIQYHDWQNHWQSYDLISKEIWLDDTIREKITAVTFLLTMHNIPHQVVWNTYFPLAHLFEGENFDELTESPAQVFCYADAKKGQLIVEYMPEAKFYRLSYVRELKENAELNNLLDFVEKNSPDEEKQKLYVYHQIIHEAFDVTEIMGKVLVEKILLSSH